MAHPLRLGADMSDRPNILFSLTDIRKSNTGFGSRLSLELVYGEKSDALTMSSRLRLTDTEVSEVAIPCRLDLTVLDDRSVQISTAPRSDHWRNVVGTDVQGYTFPFGRLATLTRGGRMMGRIIPVEDATHAARIELAPGVDLEPEESRNIRCWHCLARHRIKENKVMVCGHFGCRARLPALAVPYPLERPGFEPFRPLSRRTD